MPIVHKDLSWTCLKYFQKHPLQALNALCPVTKTKNILPNKFMKICPLTINSRAQLNRCFIKISEINSFKLKSTQTFLSKISVVQKRR